jgi:hypothetical protein
VSVGDVIALCCVSFAVGVVVRAVMIERRLRRDREQLGIGGRGLRR